MVRIFPLNAAYTLILLLPKCFAFSFVFLSFFRFVFSFAVCLFVCLVHSQPLRQCHSGRQSVMVSSSFFSQLYCFFVSVSFFTRNPLCLFCSLCSIRISFSIFYTDFSFASFSMYSGDV